jgi:hypothetical protein
MPVVLSISLKSLPVDCVQGNHAEHVLTCYDERNLEVLDIVRGLMTRKQHIVLLSSCRYNLDRIHMLIGSQLSCMWNGSYETDYTRGYPPCILATYDMVNDNLNISIADAIILATPASNHAHQQTIRRIIRAVENLSTVIVDLYDNGPMHLARSYVYRLRNISVLNTTSANVGSKFLHAICKELSEISQQ